jgi:hypothetical protein
MRQAVSGKLTQCADAARGQTAYSAPVLGAATSPRQVRQLRQKLIDAVSHDAAVLKQKEAHRAKSFSF